MSIVLRFEGCYSLSDYLKETKYRNKKVEIIRSMRRNVYILGPNGIGKSTWGNLISGQNLFEVGRSNHTTMIPQSCDINTATKKFEFRLWDTPGLFDGSEQQGHMQEYMNREIDVNGYCSGVVFVFPDVTPANETTTKILEYAVERFGPLVKENYFAIINEIHESGDFFNTYAERLEELGFQLKIDRVFVSDGKKSPNADALRVRQVLGTSEPTLVTKHLETYEAFMSGKYDPRIAMKSLFQHRKEELESILRGGRIILERFTSSGPAMNISVPRDMIRFKQTSKGFLSRTLGTGKEILEERSVKLKDENQFITLVLATLNQEYSFTKLKLFIAHILPNDIFILMHTPNGECDYELWDTRRMKDEELRDLMARNLM